MINFLNVFSLERNIEDIRHSLFFFSQKLRNFWETIFTNFLSFTETEGLQKLFYFKESENECAKERLKVNNI